MSEIETYPVEPVEVRRGVRCAYCGDLATHAVLVIEGGIGVGAGYCCDEPTHWAWLMDSVERFEEERENW